MNKWTTSEGHFKSFDDTELFCRSWKPGAPSNKALTVIHRGHELYELVGHHLATLLPRVITIAKPWKEKRRKPFSVFRLFMAFGGTEEIWTPDPRQDHA